MFDTEYATLAVVVIALGVVTPLAAGVTVPAAQADRPARSQASVHAQTQGEPTVQIQNFSADTVSLTNVTATDVVVRELTVRQSGQRRNVTLQNVSVPRVTIERMQLSEVRLRNVTVRSESLLSDFGVYYARGANVTNASRQQISLRNRTIRGVVIQHLTVEDASALDLAPPANVTGDVSANASTANFVVGNATVGSVESLQVSVGNGTAAPGTETATNETRTTTA